MKVDLSEKERDFLEMICSRARLMIFSGKTWVTHKLDYDPDELDVLISKLKKKSQNDGD